MNTVGEWRSHRVQASNKFYAIEAT